MAENEYEKIRVIESALDPICEAICNQQEYFKVLLTMNTATLLITITFWEKIVRNPHWKYLILLPLISFAVSLVNSLKEVNLFSAFHMLFVSLKLDALNTVGASDQERQAFTEKLESTKKTVHEALEKIATHRKWAERSYFFGLGLLLVFAVLSLLLRSGS